MAINKATLAKEIDGVIEYIYPKTSADIVVYDETHSVAAMIQSLLTNKADKVDGKGLSANDFTNTLKQKLDGIAENANNYSLPLGTPTVRGGFKLGFAEDANGRNYPVQVLNEQMFVHVPWTDANTTYTNATQNTSGLMSSVDKTKLDNIASRANAYVHPTHTATSGAPGQNQTPGFGDTFNVAQISSDSLGHVTENTTRTVKIPNNTATQSAAGLMSANDKKKLDGISENANNYQYTHPTVGAKTGPVTNNQSPAFGGSFTLEHITSDENGHVSAVVSKTVTIPNKTATTSENGLMSATDKVKLDGIVNATTSKAGLMSAADKTKLDGIVNATTSTAGLMSAADKIKLDGIKLATVTDAGLMSAEDKQKLNTIENAIKQNDLLKALSIDEQGRYCMTWTV